MSGPVVIPEGFLASVAGRAAEGGPSGDAWLRTLPGLVRDCLDQWDLEPDGAAWHGVCALVLPCRRGAEAVALKVTWPHPEARFEHLALRQWDGRGAVRMLAADPSRWAMLLERVDGDRDLHSMPLLDACEVLGGLFRRLDAPPVPRVDDLPDLSERWLEVSRAGSPHVPRRMTQRAAALLTDLVPGSREGLVHRDLHYANVLARRDGEWLAIDPKPINGEWAFAVAPALWNRWDEALAAHSIRAHLRWRLGVLCEAAGVDEDRARDWSFVRLVLNALGSGDDPAFLSCCVTAAKAMQE